MIHSVHGNARFESVGQTDFVVVPMQQTDTTVRRMPSGEAATKPAGKKLIDAIRNITRGPNGEYGFASAWEFTAGGAVGATFGAAPIK